MTDAEQVHIFAWNVHRGTPAKRITAVLDSELRRGRPHYIALDEVAGKEVALGRWAHDNGYRHLQETSKARHGDEPVPEHGSTCLMVDRRREGFVHLKDRFVVMTLPWRVFSHNQLHRPRRYPQSLDRLPGGRVKARAIHFPTNGFDGGNKAAFVESATKTAAMLVCAGSGTLAVAVGDINEKVSVMRQWAARFGGRVDGHNVDACIVAHGDVEAERLDKFGSDHFAMRYTLTRRPARRRRRRRSSRRR